jgi:hypothetical protein
MPASSRSLTCSSRAFDGVFPVVVVGIVAPRTADDPGIVGKLAVGIPVVEGRQQLAMRKVAGGSEHDEIEFIHFNDAYRHGSSLLMQRLVPTSFENGFG